VLACAPRLGENRCCIGADPFGARPAFLFGRRAYEIFAGSWGTMADPSGSPIAEALHSRPKYVASTTLTDPQWADTTVLSGDVAAAVREVAWINPWVKSGSGPAQVDSPE
jgi:hypothetical protein